MKQEYNMNIIEQMVKIGKDYSEALSVISGILTENEI